MRNVQQVFDHNTHLYAIHPHRLYPDTIVLRFCRDKCGTFRTITPVYDTPSFCVGGSLLSVVKTGRDGPLRVSSKRQPRPSSGTCHHIHYTESSKHSSIRVIACFIGHCIVLVYTLFGTASVRACTAATHCAIPWVRNPEGGSGHTKAGS